MDPLIPAVAVWIIPTVLAIASIHYGARQQRARRDGATHAERARPPS